MTTPEIQRAASFLAAHALLYLGVGIALAAMALAAVIGAIRLLRHYREAVRSAIPFLPGPYFAIHLVLGLALTAALSVFVVIAENVIGNGAIATFDAAFAQALRESSTAGWTRFFTAVSWLGTGYALVVATCAVAVHLGLKHDRLAVAGWVAAQAGGWVLIETLKQAFERTRPPFADPQLAASSFSFPSGHAMGTFVLLGAWCYITLRNVRSWTAAAGLVILSLAWCVVMAFSRLYLGVHFASDVVAGVVAGVAWVAVCASAFEVVRFRRASRGPSAGSPSSAETV
jgi:undecaprenyl-diphosphatase